jgi:phosphoribosyl 1,2-cyclic phosphate phosphodiesterase
MRLTFLGTGTSFGVPQIGCDCAVCRSTDPRDKRTRSGAVLESAGSTILIDTPPELRLQLITAGFSRIDVEIRIHLFRIGHRLFAMRTNAAHEALRASNNHG